MVGQTLVESQMSRSESAVSPNVEVDADAKSPDARAMLLAKLADFVTRHRPSGQLSGDATEPAANGYMVSVALFLRRQSLRWVTLEQAMRKLVLSDLLATAS
jgi:hypothetical protein